MAILIAILHVIGILILILLAILLIILLITLFFPIQYKVDASKNGEEINANAKIWWLFGLVRVLFVYPEPGKPQVKVIWIDLMNRKKKPPKEKKEKHRKASQKEQYSAQINTALLGETVPQVKPENTQIFNESLSEELVSDTAESSEGQETKESFTEKLEKLYDTVIHIPDKLHAGIEKVQNIGDNIDFYIEILKSKELSDLWSRLKPKIGRILMHLLPRKFEGECIIGTGEPDTTAYIYGVYGIIISRYPLKFILEPEFEEKRIDGTIHIKGHFTTCEMIVLGIKLLFDKDLKKIIKKIKTGGQKDGR